LVRSAKKKPQRPRRKKKKKAPAKQGDSLHGPPTWEGPQSEGRLWGAEGQEKRKLNESARQKKSNSNNALTDMSDGGWWNPSDKGGSSGMTKKKEKKKRAAASARQKKKRTQKKRNFDGKVGGAIDEGKKPRAEKGPLHRKSGSTGLQLKGGLF